MPRPLRVLHLEDSPRDAEIVRHRLDVAGLSSATKRRVNCLPSS